MIRSIPNFNKEGGCRPIFRIYGQDPLLVNDRTPKNLFSTSKRNKRFRACKQVECELVKIDINCHVQGDIVVECIHLCEDMECEVMMFRIVFYTAFIRSNIMMLNRDEIDMLWDAKDLFPKEFRVELLFSEMDADASIVPSDLSCFGEKEGLPVEAFAKVKEMFNHLDWLDPVNDAALHMLQKINTSNIAPGDMRRKCRHGLQGFRSPKAIPKYQERSRSQSSSSCDYDNPLAQKTSPHGSMDASDSQSMMVCANSKQDPPKLVFENQTSLPASTTRNLLPDNDTCNDYQSMDVPMSTPSTVQDPIQTSSTEALVPTKVMNLSSAPHPPPPPQPQCTVVNSAMETPMLTPTPPPLPPPNCEPPRYPPPPPPVSPSHLATSSTLEGPPTPPPLTLSQPPPPSTPPLRENPPIKAIPPPPPSPPFQSGQLAGPNPTPLVPSQAPPFPNSSTKQISSSGNSLDIPSAPHPPPLTKNSFTVPPAPPPPTQNSSALPSAPPPTLPGKDGLGPGLPSPPLPPLISPGNAKGRGLTRRMGSNSGSNKKLKPLHWLKLSRAVQGSLWAEAQTSDDATKAPEIDMLELENLFAASVPASDSGRMPGQHSSNARKQERVQLIDHRQAYNCEIMLSKVKVPLPELMGLVLALEESVLDIDQVENLIKFCPTRKRWNYLRVIMEKKIS